MRLRILSFQFSQVKETRYLLTVLIIFLSLVVVTQASKYEEAEVYEDLLTFQKKYFEYIYVVYYVKSEKKSQGFFDKIFNIFSGPPEPSEPETPYIDEIAENYPVIKVDIGKEELAKFEKEFRVRVTPYVVALHKYDWIYSRRPNSNTVEEIKQLLISRNKMAGISPEDSIALVTATKESLSETAVEETKASEIHNHPKPVTVVPDYGHISDPTQSKSAESRSTKELDAENKVHKHPKTESASTTSIPSSSTTVSTKENSSHPHPHKPHADPSGTSD